MSNKPVTTPEEVLNAVEELAAENRARALHIARLKMWAQVGLQGLTPDLVRAFSTREADIKDSYTKWLRSRKRSSQWESTQMMGRATFGMTAGPGPEDPEWVSHVRKSRTGRYEGTVYTVAILKSGEEVRLDPPIVVPPDA